ncbi:YheU family protein [Thalassolituus pacificus]|uniref:YheU family protein n=1 Tax=Thalassolituus pacificus TaxID=2975440 RepID=A0A9X2WED6_9GAMM|nr:YheU family protein [Thalassolituus pacificus]MCT7358540.1 YheU family protein [Thalassolituus pacificus]
MPSDSVPSDDHDYTSTSCEDAPYGEDAPQEGVLAIPYQRLSAEALDAILEDFVCREGTDYGDYDVSLADKKVQVKAQLADGSAILLFDPIQQTCHIEMTRVLRSHGWSGGDNG